jgi:hypothetical protein
MPRTLASLAGLLLGLALAAPVGGADQNKEKKITIDKEKRTVIVPAKVAPRKIDDPRYKEIYPIEVIACWPFPRGKKAHETVVTIEVKPSAVHKALVDMGLKAGKPARTETDKQTGPEVKVFVEIGTGKAARRIPIERLLVDRKTNLPMPRVKWLFTGSSMARPDPDRPAVYGADVGGTLIAIFPVTDETVFQSSLTLKDEKYVKLETNTKLLPAVGTPVRLVIVASGK